MRKSVFLLGCAWLALVAVMVYAEVGGGTSISVTQTVTTTTLATTSTGYKSLTLINDAVSANEMYARVFSCGETAAAATTSSIRLEPGESLSFTHGPTDAGGGYCAYSLICATGETATARVIYK